ALRTLAGNLDGYRIDGAVAAVANGDFGKHHVLRHQCGVAQRVGPEQDTTFAIPINDGGVAQTPHLDGRNGGPLGLYRPGRRQAIGLVAAVDDVRRYRGGAEPVGEDGSDRWRDQVVDDQHG